jgi:DNA-binding PucR family transcriptional regulator
MADLATKSNPALPASLIDEIEQRRPALARHMTRAVVTLVRWDDSAGAVPLREAIERACAAGIDLFLATAREARPATHRELREVAQLGILQARTAQSVEPVLAAYRMAARVAWNAILRAWRGHPDASPEALVVTANYVFAALDQVAAQVTRTYVHAREQHMLRGTRARTRLVHSLISDTFDNELAIQKQALALGVKLAPSYVALIVKTDEDHVQDLLEGIELPPNTISDITEQRTLVVLLPSQRAETEDDIHALLAAFSRRGRPRFRAGLGGEYAGLRGISRSYLEAHQAVDIGRKLQPEAVLHHHDQVAPYLVLAQNPVVAERYVKHVLGSLQAPDRKPLLETVEAVLTFGSVKAAAAHLGLHRHTVLYRMEKVTELLGADPNLPALRHRLQLALYLRKLL